MFDVALREIVGQLGGELVGDGAMRIDRIGPLDGATASTIAFLASARYQSQLGSSNAGCVIVAPAAREAALARGAAIITADPYLYFARLTQWWAQQTRPAAVPGVHATASVDPSAQVVAGASIGPFAVIEAGCRIAEGVVIGAHCVIGAGASIGAGTRLAARVTLGTGCTIGARGIVHSGVVIGADGFGFAPDAGRWCKIEQLGAVSIGDDVEIGANTCIDRGALDDTVIEDGVKLDNLIQVGHNVRIGAHTAIAAFTGIAGSAVIGRHCMIGGAARIGGHIRIVDHVTISACTMVSHSVTRVGVYSGGFPMDDNATWVKNAATLRQLHTLRDRLRALEKKIT